jgi:hypothetical protein
MLQLELNEMVSFHQHFMIRFFLMKNTNTGKVLIKLSHKKAAYKILAESTPEQSRGRKVDFK